MATKVIVIGEQKEETNKKRIEFVRYLKPNFKFSKENSEEQISDPSSFDFVELICKDYAHEMDLMFAYDELDDRGDGTLYLGHFNGGIV